MKLPVFPVEGGCQCRAVRYQITAPPLGVYNCHCKDCQRSSGGTHTMSMPTRREHVVLLQGELVAFRQGGRQRARCAHDGVRALRHEGVERTAVLHHDAGGEARNARRHELGDASGQHLDGEQGAVGGDRRYARQLPRPAAGSPAALRCVGQGGRRRLRRVREHRPAKTHQGYPLGPSGVRMM